MQSGKNAPGNVALMHILSMPPSVDLVRFVPIDELFQWHMSIRLTVDFTQIIRGVKKLNRKGGRQDIPASPRRNGDDRKIEWNKTVCSPVLSREHVLDLCPIRER